MKRKDILILGADFETTGEAQYKVEGRTRVYLYHFRDLKEEIKEYGTSIEDFFYALKETSKTYEKPLMVYFHNLSFDGSFILFYLYSNGFKYIEDYDEDLEENSFKAIIDDFKNIYQIKLNYMGVNIDFRDSYRNIPTSIDKLGKAFGIFKLGATHNYTEFKNYENIAEVPEEEIKYITNDVRILIKAVNYMRQNKMTGLTFSSSAYNNLKQSDYRFFRDKLNKPNDDYVNNIIDKSCRGGFTNYNPLFRNKIVTNLMSFDYNSLYPAVMLEDEMPYGVPKLVLNEEEAKAISNYNLHIYEIYIENVTIKTGLMPFLGLKSNVFGMAYDYTPNLQDKVMCLWEGEFNLFKSCYEGSYVISHILCFKSRKFLFKKFLKDKIATKEKSSWKLHEIERLKNAMKEDTYIELKTKYEMEKRVAKLYMNGVSGKFGMKDERYSSVIDGYDKEGALAYHETASHCDYYYRAIYSKITSGGRARIISLIESNADKVVYWDTDSIYLLGNKPPINLLPLLDDNKIGFLKYEGHYKRMKVIKAKCYIKELDSGEIVKSVAGATDEIKDLLNFETFKEGFTCDDQKKSLCHVKGGAIIKVVKFSIGVVNESNFLKGEEY